MIVWIASYPRSGNTFFRILLHHLIGIHTFSIYDDPIFCKMGASEIVGHRALPGPIEMLKQHSQLYFVKTHDLPQAEDHCPTIYIVRDGRDALVSLARSHVNPTRSRRMRWIHWFASLTALRYRRALRRFIVEGTSVPIWNDHVLAWSKESSRRKICIIKYEQLVNEPFQQLKRAFSQLDLPFGNLKAGTVPRFDELHQKWPAFFRKGCPGAWRDDMPKAIQALFWKYHRAGMEALEYA
jgi:hypothetical protein